MQVKSRSTWWAVVGVWVAVLIFVFAGALLIAGCTGSSSGTSPSSSSSSQVSSQSVLRCAFYDDVTTWDPAASYSTEVIYMANCYEPLIYANPTGSAEPFSPALATSWEHSSNGLVWTFHLRSGVKFHDGTPFNAAAVKYSVDRTMKMNLGAAYLWAPVKEVKVVNNLTVQFVLSSPVAFDRIVSADYGAWMYSPATKGWSQAYWNAGHEDGTGPYMLTSYKPNQQLVFTQNKDWWGGWKANQFKEVDVQDVTDAGTQREMLQAGEVDNISLVGREQVNALKADSDVSVYIAPSLDNYLMFFNTQRKPLNNVNVRQALSYAIPYQNIITVGAGGFGVQARGPVPTGLWPNAAANLPQYTYDIAKAKQMLAAAGYPNGGFNLKLTYTATNANEADFMPLIKQGFAQVGVGVTLEPLTSNQCHTVARGALNKRQDLAVNEWWPSLPDGIDNLRPMFMSETTVGANWAYWYRPQYDKDVVEAYKLSATNLSQAQKLYTEAQMMLINQAPAAYLFDTETVVAHLKTVAYDNMAINYNYPEVLFFSHVTKVAN